MFGDRPVREVVDRHDLVVLGEQLLADVRPDEPGRAGDPDLSSCRLGSAALAFGEAARGSPARRARATPVTAWPLTISG